MSNISDIEILRKLGSGFSIESIMESSGMSRCEFDAWWQVQISGRVPDLCGSRVAKVSKKVEIVRGEWGIPHILASCDEDLFYGYGYAMGQDRLWQLDYLRRKAMGRLSEILGPMSIDQDVVSRTVGIGQISAAELAQMPIESVDRLEAFSNGINLVLEESRTNLPIEFSLLGYEPEPWTPLDSVAIWCEFRWYLTGRLGGIAVPELAKRSLGTEDLYRAFLTVEADEESIVPRGAYEPGTTGVHQSIQGGGDVEDGLGSNNWVIGAVRTANHMPIVASDPHIAFGSVSCWYQAHLSGGHFNVVGSGYTGVPFLMFGRNEHLAWGLTNNICSQRDLYLEKTDPEKPGYYLFDGRWELGTERTERINVKGAETVEHIVCSTRNGPIVDQLLPPDSSGTGPVSMRWMGQSFSDELTCFHTAHQATNCSEFREAFREFKVPTLSIAFADLQGQIGYQCVGSIPIRDFWDRAYFSGWDPDHQWKGTIPFDSMPALSDPQEGWVRSANNRTAPPDYPYPLSGMWPSGLRARRIRQMIESSTTHSRADVSEMQVDFLSLRAIAAVPGILDILDGTDNAMTREAIGYFHSWDFSMDVDSVAATIFEEFFHQWVTVVASERFPKEIVSTMSGSIGGLAVALLSEDRHGWFVGNRHSAVGLAMILAINRLVENLGPDMSKWNWGSVHMAFLPHHLSDIGDLGTLLDLGGDPVGGTALTVGNVGAVPFAGKKVGGANYRMVADLSDLTGGLWSVDHAGQSGHPGSSHYGNQFPEWLAGRQYHLPIGLESVKSKAEMVLCLEPVK